jgi:hypothetical protein
VYFVINFGVFFFLNTAAEVKLVSRMHKELNEKKERLARMNSHNLQSSSLPAAIPIEATSSSMQAGEDRTKADKEDKKKKMEVIKMVLINGVLNFILRAPPEILFWMENCSIFSEIFPDQIPFLLVLVAPNFGLNFYVPGLLSVIADIGYLSYLLTFTTKGYTG